MTLVNREMNKKLVKGLLDLIVLEFLRTQPMYGYQILVKIRKTFKVYFGAGTIYPLLDRLERKGLIENQWNFSAKRMRKIFKLTNDGQNVLALAEESASLILSQLVRTPENEARLFVLKEGDTP